MAFVNQDEEDAKQADPNAAAPTTGASSDIISGQGSTPAQGAAPTAAGPTTKADNFVGIKDYLDANKQQSSKLGDQVAGQVQNKVDTAGNQISGLDSGFKSLADQGQFAGINTAGDEAKGLAQKAASAPVGQFGAPDVQRFGQIANAQYSGPKQLSDTALYGPAYQSLTDAQNYADLSKTEGGNQQLLKNVYNQPNYTAGENRLDSYLLNTEPNQAKLSQARAGAAPLQTQFDAAGTNATNYAQQQQAQVDALRQQVQSALGQTQAQRNQAVQSELDQTQGGWNSEYDNLLNSLKNSNGGTNLQLTEDQMKKLGITGGQRIYNMLDPNTGNGDPSKYLTQQAFDPNKVISKDEQAQLAALDQLAGTYGGQAINKYTQGDLAGTETMDNALDASAFGAARNTAEGLFNTGAGTANMAAVFGPDSASAANANGSVADYLSGKGPTDTSNTSSYDSSGRAVMTPQMQYYINNANADWTKQILDYLQNAGYNNSVHSPGENAPASPDKTANLGAPPPTPTVVKGGVPQLPLGTPIGTGKTGYGEVPFSPETNTPATDDKKKNLYGSAPTSTKGK